MSLSEKLKAGAVARRASGFTSRALSDAEALAAFRKATGSRAVGAATGDELEALDAFMAAAGCDAESREPGVNAAKAAALGMSADELHDLVKR